MRHAQGVEHLALQLEDAPCITKQHLALGGKAHLAAVALEKLALKDVFLQALHLHADGRLSPVDHLAGAGKAALLGNGDEGTQHIGIEALILGHCINLRDASHQKHSLD